jgi:hypothetical protein
MIICNGMERTVNQIDRIADLLFLGKSHRSADEARRCGTIKSVWIVLYSVYIAGRSSESPE